MTFTSRPALPSLGQRGAHGRVLKTFLESDTKAAGEHPQFARYLFALRAAQMNRLEEAEAALADYLRFEPRKADEHAKVENALTCRLPHKKQPERAAAHAEEAFKAAKSLQATREDPAGRPPPLLRRACPRGHLPGDEKAGGRRDRGAGRGSQTGGGCAVCTPVRDATEKLADVLIDSKRKPEAIKIIEAAIIYADQHQARGAALRASRLAAQADTAALQGEIAPEISDRQMDRASAGEALGAARARRAAGFLGHMVRPVPAAFPHLTSGTRNTRTAAWSFSASPSSTARATGRG